MIVAAVRSAGRHERLRADPEARTAAAVSILGGGSLPDGYFAATTMTLPGLLRAVILTDAPPEPDSPIDRFRDRLFLYMESGNASAGAQPGTVEMEPLLDLWPGRLRLEARESGRVENGSVPFPAWQVDYRKQEGVLVLGPHRLAGPFMTLVFRCSGDSRRRTALWFDPSAGDPATLRRFLADMEPCGSSSP